MNACHASRSVLDTLTKAGRESHNDEQDIVSILK